MIAISVVRGLIAWLRRIRPRRGLISPVPVIPGSADLIPGSSEKIPGSASTGIRRQVIGLPYYFLSKSGLRERKWQKSRFISRATGIWPDAMIGPLIDLKAVQASSPARSTRAPSLGRGSRRPLVQPLLQRHRVVADLVAGGEEQGDGLACQPIDQVANRRLRRLKFEFQV